MGDNAMKTVAWAMRVLRLGQADVVEGLGRGDSHLERPRIGVPDVLATRR